MSAGKIKNRIAKYRELYTGNGAAEINELCNVIEILTDGLIESENSSIDVTMEQIAQDTLKKAGEAFHE